jgi:TonB family protein
MAHVPISRLDPSDPPDPERVSPVLEEGEEAGVFLSYLAATLSSHGGGASSADLALDLVLNEIVEQTRLATNATGAAIALARDGEIICRATTGANAPDLGVRLDAHSGLSGACVQTRQWQRCDDTESDPRVDAALCRRLGVRSILVYPVLRAEKLAGVVEVFSSRPKAFSDREIQTLKALSRTIVDNIERAAEVKAAPTTAPAAPPAVQPAIAEREKPQVQRSPAPLVESPAAEASASSEALEPATQDFAEINDKPRRDYATTALTIAVIGAALLLGWMIGLTGRQRTPVAKTRPVQPAPATAPSQPIIQTATTAPSPSPPAPDSTPPAASSPRKSEDDRTPSDGLVVYDKGKVVFRMPSSPTAGSGQPGQAATTPRLSPEVANESVTLRVEPEYPEIARQQHIQGPVVLEALVGKDGAVETLKTVSGDPTLAAAATDAVKQWRFKPFNRNGKTEEFQTQITVSFRLP